ncbi:hypothetical protein [Limimaricola sp.]|uniref:hypothetical protein n=1 Tax=Limimaricola sp. TaxID=2211665 RepID=UPI004059E59A
MFNVSYSVEARSSHRFTPFRQPDARAVRAVHDYDAVALAPLPRERGAGLILTLLALFPIFAALGAKSLLLARLDPVALSGMVSDAAASGVMGRALAWLMQSDPLSTALAPLLAGLLG